MERRPRIIAVTGTIGAGKSLVGKILEDLEVPVIDSDKLVHHLLNADTPTRKAVVERFGTEVQAADGAIDRRKLGPIVFKDPAARKDLESIVHPAVILECRRRIQEQTGKPLVGILVPLLFETGLGKEYDEAWTVIINEGILRERLKKRDNLTDQQIDQRLNAQWSQERKAQLANHIIDNSGTPEETRRQVTLLVHKELAALK
ncbi:MAG TPA: dephospho-CoA kinase [Planktothrix sp.]